MPTEEAVIDDDVLELGRDAAPRRAPRSPWGRRHTLLLIGALVLAVVASAVVAFWPQPKPPAQLPGLQAAPEVAWEVDARGVHEWTSLAGGLLIGVETTDSGDVALRALKRDDGSEAWSAQIPADVLPTIPGHPSIQVLANNGGDGGGFAIHIGEGTSITMHYATSTIVQDVPGTDLVSVQRGPRVVLLDRATGQERHRVELPGRSSQELTPTAWLGTTDRGTWMLLVWKPGQGSIGTLEVSALNSPDPTDTRWTSAVEWEGPLPGTPTFLEREGMLLLPRGESGSFREYALALRLDDGRQPGWAAKTAVFGVAGDVAVVEDGDDARGFDLASGNQLWRLTDARRFDLRGSDYGLYQVWPAEPGRIVSLQPRTGRERWSAEGTGPGDLLYESGDLVVAAPATVRKRFVFVDRATGEVRSESTQSNVLDAGLLSGEGQIIEMGQSASEDQAWVVQAHRPGVSVPAWTYRVPPGARVALAGPDLLLLDGGKLALLASPGQ